MAEPIPLWVDAKIRGINARFLESRDSYYWIQCCRDAYDVLAEYWQNRGTLLESVLKTEIPAQLLEAACPRGWLSGGHPVSMTEVNEGTRGILTDNVQPLPPQSIA